MLKVQAIKIKFIDPPLSLNEYVLYTCFIVDKYGRPLKGSLNFMKSAYYYYYLGGF